MVEEIEQEIARTMAARVTRRVLTRRVWVIGTAVGLILDAVITTWIRFH